MSRRKRKPRTAGGSASKGTEGSAGEEEGEEVVLFPVHRAQKTKPRKADKPFDDELLSSISDLELRRVRAGDAEKQVYISEARWVNLLVENFKLKRRLQAL